MVWQSSVKKVFVSRCLIKLDFSPLAFLHYFLVLPLAKAAKILHNLTPGCTISCMIYYISYIDKLLYS